MPYEIKFENTPVGIALHSARDGDSVTVQSIAFFSEEDGDKLIDQLEGFGSDILAKLPGNPPIQPAQIEHLLAIIRRDNTATVYVNELRTRGMVQVKREFKAGDAIFTDDIADVHRLEFDGVPIPKDAGVIFIFSVGWRRALFFDLSPLSPKNPEEREYDIGAQLGQFYAYLIFQKRFKISERQWKNLFDGQWFPFITLKEATIRTLVSHSANAWPLDDLSDAIAQEVKAALPTMLARWKVVPSFSDHMPFLQRAVEHYLKSDFISTPAILYPRIEGLLRSHQQRTDSSAAASQKGLSKSATKKAEAERHPSSPLLPSKFREYLEDVYFAAFNPADPKIKVSRNSMGHGVASADECSLKSATIGMLIVDQLCYCFSEASPTTAVRHNLQG